MIDSLGPINLILLVIPAVALRIAVRALFGRKRLAVADPMQMLLSLASNVMFALALLGPAVALAGMWFLLIPLPIATAIVALMIVDCTRHAEHRALVWALAAAAQRGIPLSEAARAYADETLGDTGVRSLALAEALERGEPLSQAVRSARLRMGAAMKLAVRLGEALGLLGPAMRQQLGDSQQTDMALRDAIARFFYLGNVLVILAFIWTFIMLRIVPVFQKVFEEFGLKLPSMTMTIIDVSSWFVRGGWIVLLPVAFVIVPAFVIASFLYYAGWFPRDVPLWWWLFRRYDGALVLRGLALTVRRSMPLPHGLALLAECYPLAIVRGHLRQAASRVAGGTDWRDSLQMAGLLSVVDAGVLAAAERAGNLDWALEEMADRALRRQIYGLQVLLQILFPMAVLAFGAFMGVFVMGLFLPLIALIQGLS